MIGKKIVELESIDSTNAYANKLLLRNPLEDGVVIWAHEQFAGRGQHDHIWVSETGKNLTFTVIFRPVFLPPDRQFLLNKVVALAVIDFIGTSMANVSAVSPVRAESPGSSGIINPSVSIKWPNDIYVGDLKIGGILIEHKIMGNRLETSLAGIGVNINQTHFTPDIPNPGSLIQFLHRETLLKDSLLMVCRYLDLRYNKLKESGPESLDFDFNQHLLGFGKWRKFTCLEDTLEGKIRGVNSLGQLLIETQTGEILEFNHREIEYILKETV